MAKSSWISAGLRRKISQPLTASGDRDGTNPPREDGSDEINVLIKDIGLSGDVAQVVGDAFRKKSLIKTATIEKVFRGRFQKNDAENWVEMLLGEDQKFLAVTVSELLVDHFKLGKMYNYLTTNMHTVVTSIICPLNLI